MKASAPVAGIVGLLLLAGVGYIEKTAVVGTTHAGERGTTNPVLIRGAGEVDALGRDIYRLDTGIDSELAALREELEELRSELDALRRAQAEGGGG